MADKGNGTNWNGPVEGKMATLIEPELNFSLIDTNLTVVENGPSIFVDFGMPTLESEDSIKKTINSAITALSVALLVEVMLGMGCSVDLDILKQHLKKPVGVIASAVTQFGIMPAIAFGLAKGLHLGQVPAMATLLTASVPGGSLSNILTYLARGDMSLSMLMTTVSTLLSLGFIPLNLILYGTAYLPPDRPAASIVPFSAIVLSFAIMLVPMTSGILLRRKWPNIVEKVVMGCKIALIVTVLSLVILSCFLYGITLLVIMPKELWLIPAIMPIIGFTIGFIFSTIGGLRGDARRTVAIETGCQNCQMSVAVLKVAFPYNVIGPYFLFPFIYALFQFIEGFIMIIVTRIYLKRFNEGDEIKDEQKMKFSSAKRIYDAMRVNFWKRNSAQSDTKKIVDEMEDCPEENTSTVEKEKNLSNNPALETDEVVSTKTTWMS